jgi:tetratricopeptide (TPR) repeat protein
LQKALAAKNKGNKYFRGGRYELAIKCYTQAIEACPGAKKTDLSTFYQNRAAAYEQLVSIPLLNRSARRPHSRSVLKKILQIIYFYFLGR